MTGNRYARRQAQQGFTLIEVLVVIVLISILAAVAVPVVSGSVEKAREAALKENLQVMRKSLDDYFADHGRYPASLEALVDQRYLRFIPEDPVLEAPAPQWQTELTRYSDGGQGIHDVHSTSGGTANDGSRYADW
ncbi:type II secretion system protein [Marinobacter sp. DUT-1]|uniref:type II secretion system protein n=1 Tax=Marinobacter sp. DUT-1 TaxID=3412037 RepID=UPI003D17CA26